MATDPSFCCDSLGSIPICSATAALAFTSASDAMAILILSSILLIFVAIFQLLFSPSSASLPVSLEELSPRQQKMVAVWEAHLQLEFGATDIKTVSATTATMTDHAHVTHIPTLMGGAGRAALTAFYRDHFMFQMPADIKIVPVSRTVGVSRLVDELIISFSHSQSMDWILPGMGKRVKTFHG
jgi:hypothetical protein